MRILTIAAHPDDETLGAGATIALHAARGDEVWVCILSDGVGARHGHVELQKDCAMRACDVLGVREVVFCGLPDQRLDTLPLLDVIAPIEKVIAELRPDVVLTHFKEDSNQDHRLVFQATLVAARPVNGSTVRRLMCYEIPGSTEWAGPFQESVFTPNVYVDVSSTLDKKIEAMHAYADTHISEVRPYPHPRSYEALEIYARRYGIAAGLEAAEPFMLLREIARQGLPEEVIDLEGQGARRSLSMSIGE
jgi:LmbE family N-acetylglucosaminyl deacetylase